ncbi:MAG: hypothetical protein ACRD5H_14940, partial [Nitrososphaerales archaeon]
KLSGINDDLQKSKEFFAQMNYFNFTSFGDAENSLATDDAFDFALQASTNSQWLLEEVRVLPTNMDKSGLFGNVLDISDPLFIDENNVTSSIHEIGEPVVIESAVTGKLDHKINFTAIIQIKDSDGYTVALESLGFAIAEDETTKPSFSFVFERSGEFDVSIFLWTELDNPVPLAPVTNAKITLVR